MFHRRHVTAFLLVTALAYSSTPSSPARSWHATRQQIYEALVSNKVLNADRTILHLSHVCSLQLDDASYPVIELDEGVPKPLTMSSVNTIIVLSPKLRVVQKIDFSVQRPLYCNGNSLVVFGDLTVDGISGEGNILTFSEHGQQIEIKHVDVTHLPLEKKPPQ